MSRQRNADRTLTFTNRMRAALGRKPLKRMPKGSKTKSLSCPIARALNTPSNPATFFVYGRDIDVHDSTAREKLKAAGFKFFDVSLRAPEYLDAFVTDFDNGEYPELVK